ncbi:hypothetical protein K456DRAFT_1374510 [Colletotrichum gloeosporioides 23]|nr:hypothetical protein K456DRAFT_1374510 [Colletotrichum gloeosporioides 23]
MQSLCLKKKRIRRSLCWLFLYLTKGTACSYLLEVWCVVDQKSEKLGHADNSMTLSKEHRVLYKRGGLIILDVKTMACWFSWFFVKWQTVKHRSVGVSNANLGTVCRATLKYHNVPAVISIVFRLFRCIMCDLMIVIRFGLVDFE